jgi:3-hydroxyacyl-[acyl-carrier-protein] dehydratase
MRLEYFQMVDRIIALDPAARLVCAKCQVPDRSPVFEGHFPGYPILPGVLMIETMAQTGGWLVLATLRFSRMAFLAQVEKAKLRTVIQPGQTLQAEAELEHDGSGYAVVNARLSSEGNGVADAELRYRTVPFPNEALRARVIETARCVGVPEALLNAE